MSPTVEAGDRLISMPLLYGARVPLLPVRTPAAAAPARGDIVLVRPPYGSDRSLGTGILQPIIDLFTGRSVRLLGSHAAPFEEAAVVKRIIGVPGDVIRISGDRIDVNIGDGSGFVTEFEAAGLLYGLYGAVPSANDAENARSDHGGQPGRRPSDWPSDWPAGAGALQPFAAPPREVTLGEDQYFVAGDRRSSSLDSRDFGPVGREDLLEKLILRYFPFDRFGAP